MYIVCFLHKNTDRAYAQEKALYIDKYPVG